MPKKRSLASFQPHWWKPETWNQRIGWGWYEWQGWSLTLGSFSTFSKRLSFSSWAWTSSAVTNETLFVGVDCSGLELLLTPTNMSNRPAGVAGGGVAAGGGTDGKGGGVSPLPRLSSSRLFSASRSNLFSASCWLSNSIRFCCNRFCISFSARRLPWEKTDSLIHCKTDNSAKINNLQNHFLCCTLQPCVGTRVPR